MRLRARLSAAEIAEELSHLPPPWRIANGGLFAEWQFADFAPIAKIVRAIIRLSEKTNHHPNVEFGYRELRALYTTHSAKGLSLLDFYCAAETSAAVRRCLRA